MRFFASSSHINAWSIRKGLRRFGLDCVSFHPSPGLIAKSAVEPARNDVIFFTEEDSLLRFLGADTKGLHFYPKTLALPPDDKLAFSVALREMGESPVPFWPMQDEASDDPPILPLVVKSRSSWRDGRKLPRGWVCATEGEYRDACLAINRAGLSETDFLLQEFFPDADVISTCGFFDALNHSRNVFLTTQKTLGQGGKLSTGVIVETIADPDGLLPRTVAILDSLRYRGPFELEFVHDRRRGVYHVLELNMRFWMQHGLFIEGCENRLLERYLDRDGPCPSGAPPAAAVRLVWVDRLALIAALGSWRWGFLWKAWKHYRTAQGQGARIVLYPDARATLRFCCLEALRRIRACLA